MPPLLGPILPPCRWCPKKGYSFCPGHHWWGGSTSGGLRSWLTPPCPGPPGRRRRQRWRGQFFGRWPGRWREIHVTCELFFSSLFLQLRLAFGTNWVFYSWGTKSWWKHCTFPVQNFAHPPYLAEGQRRGRQDQGEHVACNDFRHPDSEFLWFVEASN